MFAANKMSSTATYDSENLFETNSSCMAEAELHISGCTSLKGTGQRLTTASVNQKVDLPAARIYICSINCTNKQIE